MIGLVEIRSVPTDDKFSLDVQALQRMIEEDRAAGFVPFFVRAVNSLVNIVLVPLAGE